MKLHIVLTTLIVFVSTRLHGSRALRCIDCQDCDETMQLLERAECPVLPIGDRPETESGQTNAQPPPVTVPALPVVPGVTSPPTANQSAVATSTTPENKEDSEEEDYDEYSSEYDEELLGGPQQTMQQRPQPNPVQNPQQNWQPSGSVGQIASNATSNNNNESIEVEDESEEDYDEDYDRRLKRMHHSRQQDGVPAPVCYVVRLSVNDTVITNRGCTMMQPTQQDHVCDGLYKDWTVEGCQVCFTNDCNRPNNDIYASAWTFTSPMRFILLLLTTLGTVHKTLLLH